MPANGKGNENENENGKVVKGEGWMVELVLKCDPTNDLHLT